MLTLSIPKMSCGHCSGAVTRTIHGVDPQAQIRFDMPKRTATVETSVDREHLLKELEAAGYPAQAV